ncbi:MAG: GAF domain-containing protein [Chloroflexi bacterium]|nr:GAF domain-containing protein [Chloroflexota bacterium]
MAGELRETLRFLQTENARLKDENRELREENTTLRQVLDALRTLQDVSASVTTETNALALLDRILESALTTISATAGSLMLIDEENGELVFAVVHGAAREVLTNYRLPPGTGIAGWVARHVEPVIIANVRADPRFSPSVDEHFHFTTRSMLCVPIATSRKVMGVLSALNKTDGKEFTPADLALFAVVAQLAATAMERAETKAPQPA